MQPETGKFDDQGTTAGGAARMLQKMLKEGFEGDVKLLAIALGRSQEEIEHALSGNSEAFDDDMLIKMKGISKERGIELES
ncbi:MAG: hypothetical protein M3209_19440 [Acidobacteriota bacterium]|nr:hypothetical protein [Acidobacteriota bacterium]